MKGCDITLIRQVSAAVIIPVIAASRGGEKRDSVDAVFKGSANAVAAGSNFYFWPITPNMVKESMNWAGIPVRHSHVVGS